MGVELSEREAWSLIAGSHTGILTTLRRDGSPVATAMWFVVLDDTVYLRTLARSAKAANVRRDPRVSFLVEHGRAWAELRCAHLSGRVEPVGDARLRQRIDAEFDRKYDGYRLPDDVPEATRRHYAAARIHLRLVPTRPLYAWDNAKLARDGRPATR